MDPDPRLLGSCFIPFVLFLMPYPAILPDLWCSWHPRRQVHRIEQTRVHRQLHVTPGAYTQTTLMWTSAHVNGSQFFFNFGANSTTYVSLLRHIIRYTPTHNFYVRLQIYPAELFPTRYRAFAHGISAAFGKFGAIISASAFSTLTNKIGTPAVLWSESLSSCQAGGAPLINILHE